MNITVAAKRWSREVIALHNTPVPARLAEKKARLLKNAEAILAELEASKPAQSASELGFIPLLVGGSAALIASMTKWVREAQGVKKEATPTTTAIKQTAVTKTPSSSAPLAPQSAIVTKTTVKTVKTPSIVQSTGVTIEPDSVATPVDAPSLLIKWWPMLGIGGAVIVLIIALTAKKEG